MIDSKEQSPEWTYLENGLYTVKLNVSDSIFHTSVIKENYISVLSEGPLLLSVTDVANDQGGWVKVNYARSVYDTDSLVFSKNSSSAEVYTIEIDDNSGWTAAASTVAYGKQIYSVLVPTTKDSTVESGGIINFRVIAGMNEGNFVSNEIFGYSIDNIAPLAPIDLMAKLENDLTIVLTWTPNIENDIHFYEVLKSTDGIIFEKVIETNNTIYIDYDVDYVENFYYKIRAIDFSGNESELSEVAHITITGIENNGTIPQTYYLKQNFPNPFNPMTTIEYGLVHPGNVRIIVYDVLGNIVKNLENSNKKAGNYRVNWNGLNKNNQPVSTGIYFYQIITREFKSLKKMLLIK